LLVTRTVLLTTSVAYIDDNFSMLVTTITTSPGLVLIWDLQKAVTRCSRIFLPSQYWMFPLATIYTSPNLTAAAQNAVVSIFVGTAFIRNHNLPYIYKYKYRV